MYMYMYNTTFTYSKCKKKKKTLTRHMNFLERSSVYGATLKIRKKSKFDRNQLKLSTQHKYMYMHQIKL